jgi:hypothetical protein
MGLCLLVVDLYLADLAYHQNQWYLKQLLPITESHFKPLYTIDMKVSIQSILNIDLSCQKL